MLLRKLVISLIVMIGILPFAMTNALATTNAQNTSVSYYGDKDQPGNRLHTNIMEIADAGTPITESIKQAIDTSLTNSDNTLNGESKSAIAFDLPLAHQFYAQMVEVNSLIEVTKVLIETNNDKAVHIITLGVVLYPDFVQEVFDGAALTGVMLPEDILVAAIQSGADPSLISDATAAGTPVETPVVLIPLGAGLGGGGTGGGDTTASTN